MTVSCEDPCPARGKVGDLRHVHDETCAHKPCLCAMCEEPLRHPANCRHNERAYDSTPEPTEQLSPTDARIRRGMDLDPRWQSLKADDLYEATPEPERIELLLKTISPKAKARFGFLRWLAQAAPWKLSGDPIPAPPSDHGPTP